MTITHSDTSKTVTIEDTAILDFAYLHAVVKEGSSSSILVDSNITTDTSTFTLDLDGLYYLVSIKLPTTTPTVEDVFYIRNNVILKYSGNIEYSAADIINLESVGTSFENDIVEQFIIHRYNIIRNYNIVLKEIAKNINTCLINDSLNLIRDTLMMGIYILDILILDEQWNAAKIVVNNMQMCNGLTGVNTNLKCNCNG